MAIVRGRWAGGGGEGGEGGAPRRGRVRAPKGARAPFARCAVFARRQQGAQAPDASAIPLTQDNDVHVVGVSSQAAGHKTLVPKLVAALRARGADHIGVVVGGVIPAQDYAFLRECGVVAIFGPGTRIPLAAREVIAAIDARAQAPLPAAGAPSAAA